MARGLLRRPAQAPVHMGVDEKAAGRGQDYLTVVCDIDAGTVVHLSSWSRRTATNRNGLLQLYRAGCIQPMRSNEPGARGYAMEKDAYLKRLKRIEGQVRAFNA